MRWCIGVGLVAAASAGSAQPIAFTHVRLIDGRGGPPVPNATVVIDGGAIVSAGANVPVPETASVRDEGGRTLMPGLISDHSHVGQVSGTSNGAENYTAANVEAELAQYARYGVTTVITMGVNPPLFDQLRAWSHAGQLGPVADLFGVDQGIGVPGGAPLEGQLRNAPDELFRPANPDEARQAVAKMAAAHTDLVKIWVDDLGGTVPKMDPAIWHAVIDEAHKRHLRVAAHIHDLADAQALVDGGVDILAHGVRDKAMSAGFADTLRVRGVWYVATLALDEATTAWAERQPWTLTPFARAGLSPALAAEIDDPAWRARTLADPNSAKARKSLAFNIQNLGMAFQSGVRVGFGTDSGATPLRVPGVAEHRELALSAQAGLTPLQALTLATRNAALFLGLTDRGVIAPGKRADLVVLNGDPSADLANAGRISEVWVAGRPAVLPTGASAAR